MTQTPSTYIFLPDALSTMEAGKTMAKVLEAQQNINPFLINLKGDLGAGKTTFCQGLARGLGVQEGVAVSPTFTLANEYKARIDIFHLDLYRLEQRPLDEFYEAGLDEYLNGLCLIEWPERLPDDFWPERRLDLILSHQKSGRILAGTARADPAPQIWQEFSNIILNQ